MCSGICSLGRSTIPSGNRPSSLTLRAYATVFGTRRRGRGRCVTRGELLAKVGPFREAYARHGLATHAAALAFRVLVALVPLTLLGIALLGALGLEDVWR